MFRSRRGNVAYPTRLTRFWSERTLVIRCFCRKMVRFRCCGIRLPWSQLMNTWKRLIPLACVAVAAVAVPAAAQSTFKVGELNSYKAAPAFLEPYKKGIELAIEEINAGGGVLGKKLEFVIRDDGGNPGDAVRVAEELVAREGTNLIAGTFLSNVGLARSEEHTS